MPPLCTKSEPIPSSDSSEFKPKRDTRGIRVNIKI